MLSMYVHIHISRQGRTTERGQASIYGSNGWRRSPASQWRRLPFMQIRPTATRVYYGYLQTCEPLTANPTVREAVVTVIREYLRR